MENEKRLIDADALKKYMCFKCNDEYSDEPCEPSDCVFYNAIENAPTVDAVEVVRCKDCDYYERQYRGFGFCKYSGMGRADNDFCSSWMPLPQPPKGE